MRCAPPSPPAGRSPLSRRCVMCRRMIGGRIADDMVMIVARSRVRWFHVGCALRLWREVVDRCAPASPEDGKS